MLEKNVRNKAKVEGSICNVCLVEEASTFYAHYFESHIRKRHCKVQCTYDSREHPTKHGGSLSIFTCMVGQ